MSRAFQKLGRYLLIEEIAAGGMALIYRAKLVGVEGFEKEFAIKKILPHWSHNTEFITMLIDEAKTLVPLHHNNIVQVFELGKDQDTYFIVMEFVNGVDLKKLIKELNSQNRKMPLSILCFLLREICSGLEFAHTRKNHLGQDLAIVHRDISPQNILLSFDGQVKITDFGIAKVTGKSTKTQTGVLKGKFSYMSPEQAIGKDIDAQTDIFALGTVLYEMATGKKCFDGDNDFEILEKVKTAEIIFPKDFSSALAPILYKSLAVKKSERYASITHFRRDVEKLIANLSNPAETDDLRILLSMHFANTLTEKNVVATSTEKTRALTHEDTTANPVVTKIPDSVYTIVSEHTVVSEKIPEVQRAAIANSIFIKIHHRKIIFAISVIIFALSLLKYDGSKPFSAPKILSSELINKEPPIVAAPAAEIPPEKTESILDPTPKIITYGTLKIDARPWGIATVNGQEKQTPATFRLPTDKITATVTFPPKHQKVSKSVEIKTDQTITCRASFTSKRNMMTCY